MRNMLNRETQDVRTAEAVALLCCQVKKWIGAFATALGKLGAFVLGEGIGENEPRPASGFAIGFPGFLEE